MPTRLVRMPEPSRLGSLPSGKRLPRRLFDDIAVRLIHCMLSFIMSWLAWLGLVVFIAAVAAVTGIKPKGTRHVARTHLMGVARLALLALVIIFAYLAFRARSGG